MDDIENKYSGERVNQQKVKNTLVDAKTKQNDFTMELGQRNNKNESTKTDMQILYLPSFDAELFEVEKFQINRKPKSKKKKKKQSRLQKIEEDPFKNLIEDQIIESQAQKIGVSAPH